MHFLGRYDFSKLYLLYMMEYGHMISWSILKIFLNIIRPWIYFFYDIDTLNNVCDFLFFFFFTILCDLLLFLKNLFMHVTIFLPNPDLLELLGVFAAICPLNECSVFGMLFQMCRFCFLKFVVIKFHSKPFFRNCFVMFPLLIAC